MINMISAELLKLKRKKLLLITITALLLYFICILETVSYGSKDFRSFLINPYLFILIIHSIAIGIFGITLFTNEYSNHTMGQLVVASSSMMRLFAAKMIVLLMFSAVLMFGLVTEIVICGLALGYREITVFNLLLTLVCYMLSAITLVLGLLPVIFVGVMCKRNTILPVASLFLYLMITLLPSMGIIRIESNIMAYVYPFGGAVSLQNEFLYRVLPAGFTGTPASTVNALLCILCLVAFSVFFSGLSVWCLGKKEL